MKRLFKLAFIAILSFFTIASCGAKSNEKATEGERVTLKFAALETAYGDKMWSEIIEAYKKINPNVEIELNQSKDIESTLPGLFQAEDYPDVIMLALSRKAGIPENFVKEQALAELTSILDMNIPGEKVTVRSKLTDGAVGNNQTDPYLNGKTYLMPMFNSPTGLFFNKGLFEEKGWEVPTTWDEMLDLAKIAKSEGISLLTYPTTGYLDSFLPPILAAKGGPEFLNKAMSYEKGIWDSEKMNEVFKVLGEVVKNVHPTTVANANNEGFTKNQQLVIDNKALFMPNGTWIVGEMAATTPKDFKWGMTAYPAFEKGGKSYAVNFFEHIWVPAEAKNVEAAKEFIAFLYSDVAAKIFVEKGAVQPIKNYPFDMLSKENQVFYETFKNGANPLAGGFAATTPVEGVDVSGTVYGTINSVVNGTKSVEEWQADIVKMADTLREHVIK
ncbi:carbohydrate ABC transporter substrate-binding protein [Streptobacillus moniliformis]|uniref:carbohydrate ABC transporter substrate-binding protein n=1 Tax=Streptobacillus moniliformis TaxID=34105 RepID=UPI0007E3DFE6|nr:carbohydrate ABC transporter substrate-binding protein [Streptobacillus moniliformis]